MGRTWFDMVPALLMAMVSFDPPPDWHSRVGFCVFKGIKLDL